MKDLSHNILFELFSWKSFSTKENEYKSINQFVDDWRFEQIKKVKLRNCCSCCCSWKYTNASDRNTFKLMGKIRITYFVVWLVG